ncbi:MAG TPA: flagellar filament capping protein FliD [bacterium]|nr:flagellar filament capping protein FliD [bacterium]
MSSIDFTSINSLLTTYLNQSVAALQTPVVTLKNDKASLQTKTSVFTDLETKLETLKTAAEAMSGIGSSSAFGLKSAVSSDTSVVTCEATAEAVSCSHSVLVTQLAKAHSVVSNRYDLSGTTLSAGGAGTKNFSIAVGQDTYQVSVTIAAGDTNQTVLSKIASAIDQATDGKVAASMVEDTPTTGKLSIRSASTGTVGKMTFTDTSGLLGTLGVTNGTQATNTAGGYIYADLGNNELDAIATIDGVQIISSSNTVDHAVEGLTIHLLSAQKTGADPVGLTISTDSASIKTKIESFLNAFNDAFAYLVDKTKVDTATYTRAVLAGDYPYISLKLNMRSVMSSNVGAPSEMCRALSQIGITSDKTGNFSITDDGLLSQAISSKLESVQNLFASDNGVATKLISLLDGYVAANGAISASKTGIDSKISFLNKSIEREQKYATARQKQLQDQYANMREALYALQNTFDIQDDFSSIVGI